MADRIKYPKTFHLPWSPGRGEGDRVLSSVACFKGKEVVVTEKMDGENTTIYRDFFHARSVNGGKHESRSKVAQLQAEIGSGLSDAMRICGENCYAKHSIEYSQLQNHFLAFSIWDTYKCFSWDDTEFWCKLLELDTVPVLYRGEFDEKVIKTLYTEKRTPDLMEGYVVRLAESFDYADFSKSVAKFVRKNHVQTSEHWKTQKVIPNKLATDE